MLLDTAFPPDSRVENEAVSLIKAGHRVSLFCLNYKNDKDREVINGIEVHRFSAGKLVYKLSALAYTIPLYHWMIGRRIRRFIDRVQPEALHIHDMVLGAAAIRQANKKGIPAILDLHENRPVIMNDYVHLKKWPGKLLIRPHKWSQVQTKLAQAADHVIVVTEEARKQLAQDANVPEDKIVVVPNTIHDELYLSYPLDQEIVKRLEKGYNLLYMGDTALRRGTDNAIQAVSLLKDSIPEIRLILVGSNTEDSRLKAMVSQLGLEPYVFFEGWKNVRLFPSYGHVAAICISPLKRNLHHDTTYANKIFQYMASGKPLIVSDCPAQARVIHETGAGLVYMAGNPADMAQKILELYQNPDLATQMGERGRNAVHTTWNWDQTSRELIGLYSADTD